MPPPGLLKSALTALKFVDSALDSVALFRLSVPSLIGRDADTGQRVVGRRAGIDDTVERAAHLVLRAREQGVAHHRTRRSVTRHRSCRAVEKVPQSVL